MAELDTRLPLMGTAFRPPDTYVGGALRDAALLRRTQEQSQDFWVRFNELRRTLGEQEALRVLYRDVYGQQGTPGGTAPPAAPSPPSTLGALSPAQAPGTVTPGQAPALALEDMPVGVAMDVDPSTGQWKLPGSSQYGTSGEVGRGVTLEAGTPEARPAAATTPAPTAVAPARPPLAVDDPRRLDMAQAQRLTQRDPSLGAVAETLQPRVVAPGASPTTLGSLSPVASSAPSTTATPAGDSRTTAPMAGTRDAELIRRAYMISPAAGQQAEQAAATRQTQATTQQAAQMKQALTRQAFIGQVADSVLTVAKQGGDPQAAYERGLQTLEQAGIPTSHLPRTVNLEMVTQYSQMGKTAEDQLHLAQAGYAAAHPALESRRLDIEAAKERREGRQAPLNPEYVKGASDLNGYIQEEADRRGVDPRTAPQAVMAEIQQAARSKMVQDKINVQAAQGQNQPMRAAAAKQLEAYDTQAQKAQATERQLQEIEAVLSHPAGIYERGLGGWLSMKAYESGMKADDPQAVNTLRLRQIGAGLVAAEGLGVGVSNADAAFYRQAKGALDSAKNVAEVQRALADLRRVNQKILRDANSAIENFNPDRPLRTYGTYDSGGSAGSGGAATPRGPHAGIALDQMTPQQRAERREWLRQQAGQ